MMVRRSRPVDYYVLGYSSQYQYWQVSTRCLFDLDTALGGRKRMNLGCSERYLELRDMIRETLHCYAVRSLLQVDA